MKQTIFKGIATALVTPMKQDGSIDFDAYGRLIDFQIANGISALVTCGTTGESVTMTLQEHKDVIAYAIRRAGGRVPVIAGTGSNCTADAISMTEFACGEGADGCLLVTPFYNKATQDGLVTHYTAIADASDCPLILYNVPSRTGCNLLPDTCRRLQAHPRIAAVKEASGNISQVVTLRAKAPELAVYSGNDDQIVPVLSMGGLGGISVISNILPRETSEICNRFFAGDIQGAAELQCRLLDLMHLLFCQVNPIPVKAAAAAMGYGDNMLRLPLTPMEGAQKEQLLAEMNKWGLIR